MASDDDATQRLEAVEARIDWVLARPGTSAWLKEGLRAARRRDPVAVLNDLELLDTLLRPRSEALIDRAVRSSGAGPWDDRSG